MRPALKSNCQTGKDVHRPNRWTKEYHESAVRNWKFDVPTVIISFDSPRVRVPVEQQIRRAATFFQKFPMAAGEILFKPEKMRGRYVSIDRIIANVHDLANFAAIGFTEKELGDSTLARMINIAAVRDALSRAGLGMPLHIFGSLDPISSPLYFLAGADIFDGLTWLRYAFDRGRAVYKHNYISHAMGVQLEDFRVNAKVWNDNYYYMERLKNEMIRYARTGDLCEFEHNRDLFKVAWTHCDEQLAGKG